MSQAFPHEPVMADEVVGLFAPVPPGLVLDTTLGGGGHAGRHPGGPCRASACSGIDRDPAAVAAATDELAAFGRRAVVRRSRFDALAQVVAEVQDRAGDPADASGA